MRRRQREALRPEEETHLAVPDGVGGVGDDGRPALLSVVAEDWEDVSLPRMDGHLQVWVRIEKHAFLQAGGAQICNETT